MKHIFKVQVPIDTNMEPPLALVYNEDRSIEVYLPITPNLKSFMGSLFKKYAYAHLEAQNIVIDEEAPWQNW